MNPSVVNIVIGCAVLLFGRQLFWLFVGGVGFALGMAVTTQFLTGVPHWEVVGIALVAGLLGAWCAMIFERIAVAVAGFLAGSAIAMWVVGITASRYGPPVWIAVAAGGVVGALVVAAVFDGALIVLSSALGAILVAESTTVRPASTAAVFTLLLAFGIIAQTNRWRRRKRRVSLR